MDRFVSFERFYRTNTTPFSSVILPVSFRAVFVVLLASLPAIFTPIYLYKQGTSHPAYPTNDLLIVINSLDYLCSIISVFLLQPRITGAVVSVVHFSTASVFGILGGYVALLVSNGNVWVRPITTGIAMLGLGFLDRSSQPRPLILRLGGVFTVISGIFLPLSSKLEIIVWIFVQALVAILANVIAAFIVPAISASSLGVHSIPELLSLMSFRMNSLRIDQVLTHQPRHDEAIVQSIKNEESRFREKLPSKFRNHPLPSMVTQVQTLQPLINELPNEVPWMGNDLNIFLKNFLLNYENLAMQISSVSSIEVVEEYPSSFHQTVREAKSLTYKELSNFEILLIEHLQTLALVSEDYIKKVDNHWKSSFLAFFGLKRFTPDQSYVEEIRQKLSSQQAAIQLASKELLNALPKFRRAIEEAMPNFQATLPTSQVLKCGMIGIQWSAYVHSLVQLSVSLDALSSSILPGKVQGQPGLFGSYSKRGDHRLAFFVCLFAHLFKSNYGILLWLISPQTWKSFAKSYFTASGWKENLLYFSQDRYVHTLIRATITTVSAVYLLHAAGRNIALNNPPGTRMAQPELWILITIVFLSSPSVGSFIYKGIWRIFMTFVGAFLAYVAVLASFHSVVGISPTSPGAPIVMLLLVGFFTGIFVLLQLQFPRYTYPILMAEITFVVVSLGQYSGGENFEASFSYCVARGLAIAIASAYTMLISLIVFPYFAGRDLRRTLPKVYKGVAETFARISTLTIDQDHENHMEIEKQIDMSFVEFRKTVGSISAVLPDIQYELWDYLFDRVTYTTLVKLVDQLKKLILNTVQVSMVFKSANRYLPKEEVDKLMILIETGKRRQSQDIESSNSPVIEKLRVYEAFITPLQLYFVTLCQLSKKASILAELFITPSKTFIDVFEEKTTSDLSDISLPKPENENNKNCGHDENGIELITVEPSNSTTNPQNPLKRSLSNTLPQIKLPQNGAQKEVIVLDKGKSANGGDLLSQVNRLLDDFSNWSNSLIFDYFQLRSNLKRHGDLNTQYLLHLEAGVFSMYLLGSSWKSLLQQANSELTKKDK